MKNPSNIILSSNMNSFARFLKATRKSMNVSHANCEENNKF